MGESSAGLRGWGVARACDMVESARGSRHRISLFLIALVALLGCGGEELPRQPEAPSPFLERSAAGELVLRWDRAAEQGQLDVYLGSRSPDAIDRSAPVGRMTGPELALPEREDPQARPFVELRSPTQRWIAAERRLPLEGAQNFRDLGGYETSDGRYTRWGMVFRAENLSDLTDRDGSYLQDLGLRLVCDFRSPQEAAAEPDQLPEGLPSHSLRILDQDFSFGGDIRQLFAEGDIENTDFSLFLIDLNREFVLKYPERFRSFFDLLLEPGNIPLAFHCSTGKDRTGFAAAMFLSALGVPRETVMQDYLLSNLYLEKRTKKYMRMIRWGSFFRVDPEQLRPIFEVRPEYLGTAFAAIEEHYGSVDAFLREGIGLSDDELNRLRERFLYDPGAGTPVSR